MANLERGIDLCLEISDEKPYPGENLDSLRIAVEVQRMKLHEIFKNQPIQDLIT